jgi:hypothetical protein
MHQFTLTCPIQKALYGTSRKSVDVTYIVNNFVQKGETFLIHNRTFKIDPAEGEYKHLFLTLKNGEHYEYAENFQVCLRSYEKWENETLSMCVRKPANNFEPKYTMSIQHNFKPTICSQRLPTCNILMPGWSKSLTGGPLSILEVAKSMVESGIHVRIFNVYPTHVLCKDIKLLLSSYGLDGLQNVVEWVEYSDISQSKFSSCDVFMATLYSTAFMAHNIQGLLNNKPFLYMIQDCEPFFFSHNTEAARAYSSYHFPHIPIFNSWLLQQHFKASRLSVYSELFNYPCFNYFTTYVSTADIDKMTSKTHKRLILYSRPHAERNAYEFTMQCLLQAVEQGLFSPDKWIIFGVGGIPGMANVRLKNNVTMYNIDHVHQDRYKEFLKTCDVGLSLMMTPHPSLPPFDFASSGILTVTNILFQRTTEEYRKVSHNLFPAHTSVESVVEQLRLASEKVDDYDYRVQGSFLTTPEHFIDFDYLKTFIKKKE